MNRCGWCGAETSGPYCNARCAGLLEQYEERIEREREAAAWDSIREDRRAAKDGLGDYLREQSKDGGA